MRRIRGWAFIKRFGTVCAGGVLALYGLRRRGAVGAAATGSGLALLARGLARRAFPRREASHVVSVHKVLDIAAPVRRVFQFWSHYETLPMFLSGLREVRDEGDGRSRWVVEGPFGLPFSWDAELTAFEPDRRIGWHSLPGAAVDNAGTVEFRPLPHRGTRVDIQLTYDPPPGPLGRVVAHLFGTDPGSRMDEDLQRLKALLEGRAPNAHLAAALARHARTEGAAPAGDPDGQ